MGQAEEEEGTTSLWGKDISSCREGYRCSGHDPNLISVTELWLSDYN